MPDTATNLPDSTFTPPGFDDLWATDTFAPTLAPVSEEKATQIKDFNFLSGLHRRGELDAFAGCHVIAYHEQIVGHSRDLATLRSEVATRLGVPETRLASTYVPKGDGPPIPAETLAQISNFRELAAMATRGEFKGLRGQYVVVLDGKLVGHDADGEMLLKRVNEEFGELAMQAACRYVY